MSRLNIVSPRKLDICGASGILSMLHSWGRLIFVCWGNFVDDCGELSRLLTPGFY